MLLMVVAPLGLFPTVGDAAPPTTIPEGTYSINKVIYQHSVSSLYLVNVVVSANGSMRFNITYHVYATATFYCPNSGPASSYAHLTLNDGAVVNPTDWWCTYHMGASWPESAGQTFNRWVDFPAISATDQPMTFTMVADDLTWASVTFTITPQTHQSIAYYALGDSIASGHGLMDDSDGSVGGCHISSDYAYPDLVKDSLSSAGVDVATFKSYACSGASTKPVIKSSDCVTKAPRNYDTQLCNYLKFDNQVSAVTTALKNAEQVDPNQLALVSITFGIDNIPWTNVCQVVSWMIEPDHTYRSNIQSDVDITTEDLTKSLEDILSYSNADVIVTGVHNPFNQDSNIFETGHLLNSNTYPIFRSRVCPNLPANPHLTNGSVCANVSTCYQRTVEGLKDILNPNLEDVVNTVASQYPGRVAFAPVYGAFVNHESPTPQCGKYEVKSQPSPSDQNTWIQYPDESSFVNSPLDFPNDWVVARSFTTVYGDCFHPNYLGAQQYAKSVLSEATQLGIHNNGLANIPARLGTTRLPSQPLNGVVTKQEIAQCLNPNQLNQGAGGYLPTSLIQCLSPGQLQLGH